MFCFKYLSPTSSDMSEPWSSETEETGDSGGQCLLPFAESGWGT